MTAPAIDTEQTGDSDGVVGTDATPDPTTAPPFAGRVVTVMVVLAALMTITVVVVLAIIFFAPSAGAAGSCGGG